MKVALVYDHLNKIGGAEAVLIQFAHLFPDADWYTSVWDQRKTPFTQGWHIKASWINKLPYLPDHHEWIPYLMPFVFEAFDFSAYDLVISISSAEGKGIMTKPGTVHLNYCLTPTRYLYSHQGEYLSNPLFRWIGNILRRWDLVAATRADVMIAISTQVKKRIQDVYNRNADIIFPPVDTQKFSKKSPFVPAWDRYYVTVSRLVSYKRIDLLVEAFNQSGKTLVVVGDGSEMRQLKHQARKNIHFVGAVADPELVGYYEHCRAFVQANEEDFGIAMCESLSSGHPVIAYRQGGATDIVQDGVNGLLVNEQTPVAFNQAIDTSETMSFSAAQCRASVTRFDKAIWEKQIKERIEHI